MQTLFDPDAAPLSKEELAAAIQDARECLRLWKKRALYAIAAFFLSCASVVLFWHYFFGRHLIILSTALFLPVVLCVAMVIQVWIDVRALKAEFAAVRPSHSIHWL